MRILGFKTKRYTMWFDLARSMAKASPSNALRLGIGMLWAIAKSPFSKQGLSWKQKMRKCMRCPIYDPETKQCWFVHDTTGFGCRCFMPFKAVVSEHGWGWYNLDPPDNKDLCW